MPSLGELRAKVLVPYLPYLSVNPVILSPFPTATTSILYSSLIQHLDNPGTALHNVHWIMSELYLLNS